MRTKFFIPVAVISCILALPGYGQKDSLPQTVFHTRHSTRVGVYLSGAAEASMMDGRPILLTDFGAGMSINRHYRIGFEFSFAVTNLDVDSSGLVAPYNRMRWELNTYGITFNYLFFPNKIVSLDLGTMLGLGTISKHPMDAPLIDSDASIDDSRFFAFKPYLGAQLNLTRFLSLGLGGGYRLAAGSSSTGLSDGRLSGPFGSLTLKVDIGLN